MTFEQFKDSLKMNEPPFGLNQYQEALWYAGKKQWEASHNIAQDIHDKDGAWIHAYLHREEGDIFNANYWYNKASKRMPGYSLEKEWEEIATELLRK